MTNNMFKMVSTTSGISPSFPSRNLTISTGYSLSDQHILLPINPKNDDWFCQIFKNLKRLGQNMFICQGTTFILFQKLLWSAVRIFFFGWEKLLQMPGWSTRVFKSLRWREISERSEQFLKQNFNLLLEVSKA